MYWQNDYNVTTTTNIDILEIISNKVSFDLIIVDAEPSAQIESFCKRLRENDSEVPLILTFVYQHNLKEFDNRIRKYTNTIFYKPFDLNDITKKLSALIV
jgi:DNA-binding response OmpR family regulator